MSIGNIINNVWAAVQAPYLRRSESASVIDTIDQSIGNGYSFTELDNNNPPNELETVGVDTDNLFKLGAAVQTPIRDSMTVHLYPNANQVNQTFFVNPTGKPLAISGLQCIFTTAGTIAGATAYISHETCLTQPIVAGTSLSQATGTGKSVQTGTFNLHATAETNQVGVLASPYQRQTRMVNVAAPNPGTGVIVLQAGDSLSIVFAGTLTTLVGVTITINFFPGSKYTFVSYFAAAAGTAATTSLMTSLRPRTLLYGAALWQAAETSASTLTLNVTKDASGTAPGAGTAMLASTVNLKGTALTYQQLALSATAANLSTIATDSVAVLISASSTQLAGLCVTLAFNGTPGETMVNYNAANSTVGTSEEFWIADRDYEVADFSGKWSVVGGTGAVAAVTVDTGTQTPSTGTIIQTDNTNTGFLTSGTVNVPVFATLAALHTRFIRQGQRLGILAGGTTGTLAGLQISLRLIGR